MYGIFPLQRQTKKTESIQKPVIRFLYENHYLWQLKGTMEIKRLQLIFQYSKPYQKKAKNLQIENIVTKTLSKNKIFYWAQKYGTSFQNI